MPARPLPSRLPHQRTVELANRLNSAAVHLLRRIGRDEPRIGQTAARLSALSVIVYGGPQTIGAVARREGVSTPTVSRIVDALVRDGLVRREATPEDRRAVRLTATNEGRRLMERGRARRIRRLAEELATLDAGDLAALERAMAILTRLETAVEEKEVP